MRKNAAIKQPGRPRTNPPPRAEQLRLAKRAQRARDRDAGLALCQLKLPRRVAERLRQALATPGFEAELEAFLAEKVVDSRRYPNLRLLCWNRRGPLLTDRDAFALYERNWRFLDIKTLGDDERAFIKNLADKYGNGVLNV